MKMLALAIASLSLCATALAEVPRHRSGVGSLQRLYVDPGTTGLDAGCAPYQAFVDEIVRDRGDTAVASPSRVSDGAGQDERAWAQRLDGPLLSLMGAR